MKKNLLLSLASLLLMTGCVDSLDDYNVNPKTPATVPGASLFAGAERSLGRITSSTSVNDNVFRLYVQYWTETTYISEGNYNIKNRQIDANFWNTLYLGGGNLDIAIEPGVLSNLAEAARLLPNTPFITPKQLANQQACVEVLSVYAWSTLVNTYGNVPYSEALNPNISQPKYDDARVIYKSLFKRLDAAIAQFDPAEPGMGSQDIIYNGDVRRWIRFGNSLKLRLALMMADVNGFTDDNGKSAQQLAEEASANAFTSNAEQAQVTFTSAPPNTNPLWEDLIQSGRYDFVGANTFVDSLKTFADSSHINGDPRISTYFKPIGSSDSVQYEGGVYGARNVYVNFSAPGTVLENSSLPGTLLSYSEVEFLLAEAAARGWSVGGTDATHYADAIKASIVFWTGSEEAANTYLDRPDVAYATAAGTTYREKIGYQKWIALYDQPVTAWNEWRRLDTPHLQPHPTRALSGIPVRLTYPTPEKNLNGANNVAAATAIGGDDVETKLFWDLF